jgi:hypothetical protein
VNGTLTDGSTPTCREAFARRPIGLRGGGWVDEGGGASLQIYAGHSDIAAANARLADPWGRPPNLRVVSGHPEQSEGSQGEQASRRAFGTIRGACDSSQDARNDKCQRQKDGEAGRSSVV